MQPPITSFTGPHRFLSNFWPAQVHLEGVPFPTVEHGYVAAKTLDLDMRQRVQQCDSPGSAKRLGRWLALRPDWEAVKLIVMERLLRQKFAHPALRAELLATGTVDLIEGNTWGDTYWGVCGGRGENHLGKLLMTIRTEYQESAP